MIVIFRGEGKEAARLMADSMRGAAINAKKGALIVTEEQLAAFGTPVKGDKSIIDPAVMLEKIITGAKFTGVAPANWPADVSWDWTKHIPWKNDPTILLLSGAEKALDYFENLLPGFAEKFGPVQTIATGVA